MGRTLKVIEQANGTVTRISGLKVHIRMDDGPKTVVDVPWLTCPLERKGARDHTSGTPVTTFKRSTKLYKLAMSYNRGLERPPGSREAEPTSDEAKT